MFIFLHNKKGVFFSFFKKQVCSIEKAIKAHMRRGTRAQFDVRPCVLGDGARPTVNYRVWLETRWEQWGHRAHTGAHTHSPDVLAAWPLSSFLSIRDHLLSSATCVCVWGVRARLQRSSACGAALTLLWLRRLFLENKVSAFRTFLELIC